MKNQTQKFCPYCYPYKPRHLTDKVNSYIDIFFTSKINLFGNLVPKFVFKKLNKILPKIFWATAKKTNFVREVREIDEKYYSNRALVIWREAKKRNLQIYGYKNKKKYLNHFCWHYENQKIYFQDNPIYEISDSFHFFSNFDDKAYVKKILLENDLPCPEGRAFVSAKKALAYGRQIGFPLVVKPVDSSLSRHAFFNINSADELKFAIRQAQKIAFKILVEKYLSGDVHRVVLIDHKLIACAKRMPASVVGDGESSIETLIKMKNKHEWRGLPQQKNTTLYQVTIDEKLQEILAKQNYDLKTILPAGQKVFLAQKINLGNGADTIDVTGNVCEQNIAMLEKVSRLINLPLAGLDFICEDVAKNWQSQEFGIIENNTLPYIDMHHYPSKGQPINVAEKIWDYVLEKSKAPNPKSKLNPKF